MPHFITVDGNEATTLVAHKTNEVVAIYPITPASSMGELADAWSAAGRKNLWGSVPDVIEMQSEGGAAAAVHGALQAGSLTTTFTASQGLLLMVPTMFKVAGELLPTVFHISARTVATHALSIFGDHSDVMACRTTGWGLIASGSIQEAHDVALIAQAATLESRVPFLHFFDGFRTSHEVNKIQPVSDDVIRGMLNEARITEFRERRMDPDRPVLRGTSQNPDVFFQAREAQNPYYEAAAGHVLRAMERFAELTGRVYRPFQYVGPDDAESVVMLMGSGTGAAEDAVEALTRQGHKVGMLEVHLYRPWSTELFLSALPPRVQRLAVLDRTKEPGALGEPLYTDVVTALAEGWVGQERPAPAVFGGRYGLSSKEFTPAMVKGVFEEVEKDGPRRHFTVGIHDDVTDTSIDWDEDAWSEPEDVHRAVFYGLGADGSVSSVKATGKILGENTPLHAQGYFVYDSKKAGAVTVSHLRYGERPLRSSYLVRKAEFVACHQFVFVEKLDLLWRAQEGATFLLNSPFGADEVWGHLPREVQEQIIAKGLKLFVVDALKVAQEAGLRGRINTVMQTCFFAISGVLPRDEAIAKIKEAIKKTWGRRGEEVLQSNYQAVDATLAALQEVEVPSEATSEWRRPPVVSPDAPQFVQDVTAMIMARRGDDLPVSALPADGTFPTDTTRWEKRSIANEIPIWDTDTCTECGLCAYVCPHAAIRQKVYDPALLQGAPAGFPSKPSRDKAFKDLAFTIQVAPDDCTGCVVCTTVCPAKSKTEAGRKAINMELQREHLDRERERWDFFLGLPEVDRTQVRLDTVRGSQYLQPLFEFSGACAGCGETPYVKLLTQLFGDRALIGNATGCSSIYGGNLPTTPYALDADGRGPTWNNSLFEDAAEFSLGLRLAVDSQADHARDLLTGLSGVLGNEVVRPLLEADQSTEEGIGAQRERVAALKAHIAAPEGPPDAMGRLLTVADHLVRRSVWGLGGDGWAYDIGYGGLDHVLASGRDINLLVLDTEVYSNTGGQASKATPLGAIAKFAAAGKPIGKKDLGLIAMAYGSVYVAQVAMGANPRQTIRAFLEAESWHGSSLVIAYSPCIAHGIDMETSQTHQKEAVTSGFWPLYRYDPRRLATGGQPLKLDSKAPKTAFADFAAKEARFSMLKRADKERSERLVAQAQQEIERRWRFYEQLARIERSAPPPEEE